MARAKKKTATKRKAAKKMSAAPRWRKGTKHPVTGKAVGGQLMSVRDRKLFTTTGKTRKGVGPATIKKAYGGHKVASNVAGRRGGGRRVAKAPSKKKAAPKRKAPKKKAAPKRKAPAKAKRKAAPRPKKKAAPKRKAPKKKAAPKRKAPKKKAAPKRAAGRSQRVRQPGAGSAGPKRRNPSQLTRKGAIMDVHGYMPQHGAYVVTDGSGRVLAGARTLKAARQKRTALAARNPLVATHIVKMR